MMFSFIVPIYKTEPYLDRCIKSLMGQTFREIEIILVDDGSPDNCSVICNKYAAVDNRIKVIHKNNGGLSDARNKGLEISSGKYVIFVDSDDYIDINTCERFALFAEKEYDLLIGDAIVEGGVCHLQHIDEIGTVFSGLEYLKKALSQNKAPMAAWLNVYKRDFLIKNGLEFKFGILHEDEQFTPRALLKAQTVFCTGIIFYHYIIRESSITTQNDKRRNAVDLFSTCCELESLYETIEDKNLRRLLKDSLVVKYLNIFQIGQLYRYGKLYIHKDFCLRNAFRMKSKLKVQLFCVSPKIYYWINSTLKRLH